VLEDLLICPMTQQPLCWGSEEKNSLMTPDGAIYYPVIDNIAFLLPEYAIRPGQKASVDPIKTAVQAFYNKIGWKAESGVYRDASDSEDLRTISQEYREHCHQRVKAHLPSRGRYLLDVACGPIQYPAYLSYSEGFDYRICADLSLTALQEAQSRLKEKGIYLLCDITQLPIKNNAVDAVISLHTLYHVPAEQQAKGFAELHRVLKPHGKSVIVYSWGVRSILMNLLMFPFKLASYCRRKWLGSKAPLYFYTHSYRWFRDEIQPQYNIKLFCWRSVNVPFLKIFIHPLLGGKWFLKMILFFEENFPTIMGRIGAYPLFVSEKSSNENGS
jgi:ubiquinone/menaquinone biosynthesis C-methylase UbiE/uncharacterized protein YbaR (Trm112 family)